MLNHFFTITYYFIRGYGGTSNLGCEARTLAFVSRSEPASEVADALDARLIKPKLKCGRGGMADALDLGSSVLDVQVQVLLPAPKTREWLYAALLFFVW